MEIIKFRNGIKRHIIELYENIDEMPIMNFAQLEKNLIIESGVGANLKDFEVRLEIMSQFISSGHNKKAINEINNMRNLFWNITNEIRPDMDSYSCFVHTINGEKRQNTEDGIEKTTKMLKEIGFTKKMIDHRHDLKKKMQDQLKASFPKYSGNENVQLIGARYMKMELELDEIIDDTDFENRIKKENKKISDSINSREFGNNEGDDVKYMADFTTMYLTVQSKTNIDAKQLSVYEFYALIQIQKVA